MRPGWTRVTSTALRPGKIVGTVGGELVDPRAWKDPPHMALANLDLANPKTIRMFTRLYGPLTDDVEAGDRFEVDIKEVGYIKERVCAAWRARDAKRLWFPDGLENLTTYSLPITWGARGIELAPADVWTYLRLLLTRDIEQRRAHICPNPTCEAPYFIARRNKKLCSDGCRNVVGQRNFKKRWRKRREQ